MLQTGIAVALAVLVVGVMLIFPGLSPFNSSSQSAAVSSTLPAMSSDTSVPQDQDGLQVIDETIGSGAAVAAGDTITVNYVGMLSDGTVFDASANHGGPASFAIGIGQVIPGWDQGLIGMKMGGKRKLVIPPQLAYGDQGVSSIIPSNATLTFEIELLKVLPAAQ